MSKLQGNRKIGELPEEKMMRQRMDEIVEEVIAETEHVDNSIQTTNSPKPIIKGRKIK